jgi:hypothetical protein
LDFSSDTRLWYSFYACKQLVSIDEIVVTEKLTYSSTFYDCFEFVEVRFSGTIGQSIGFGPCSKLSRASVENIKEHLKDFTGTGKENTCTISFKASVLTAEDEEYIANKKWNLTKV